MLIIQDFAINLTLYERFYVISYLLKCLMTIYLHVLKNIIYVKNRITLQETTGLDSITIEDHNILKKS